MPLLLDLPLDDCIFPFVSNASTLGALARTSQFVSNASRQNDALAWRPMVQQRWGPVRLPPKKSWTGAAAGWPDAPTDWSELSRYLETVVRPGICKSVKRTLNELLIGQGLLEDDLEWHETVRRCLGWASLGEKRRLAAFVCADWQPPSALPTFLAPMPIRGATPEAALRDLLLRFPFLPIDAGEGADRVIGCFCRSFVTQNPAPMAALGLAELDGDFKTARDAVYTLTYSIIMLNTDLHNPVIQPKITPDEYAASCRRCVPLAAASDDILHEIYASIRDQPLAIIKGEVGAAPVTAVRASETADDVEIEATYSVYSALRQQPPPPGGAARHVPAAGGILLTQQDLLPQQLRTQVPQIDWNVAYWNLVDAARYARAASWRCLVRNRRSVAMVAVAVVAFVRSLS